MATRLYLITDRQYFGPDPNGVDRLVEFTGAAARAGVDLIQVREKDLPARSLFELTRRILAATSSNDVSVLVNDRTDVAIAARAHGVHLTTRSMRPAVVRRAFSERLLIGASCHSIEEARAAAGADFLVAGPLAQTPSKTRYGQPIGLEGLRAIVAGVDVPVLALGGVEVAHVAVLSEAGCAGIAAIRLFQRAWAEAGESGLIRLVETLRVSSRP